MRGFFQQVWNSDRFSIQCEPDSTGYDMAVPEPVYRFEPDSYAFGRVSGRALPVMPFGEWYVAERISDPSAKRVLA